MRGVSKPTIIIRVAAMSQNESHRRIFALGIHRLQASILQNAKGEASFAAAGRNMKLRFESASEFRYFDYGDPDPQMQEYFAEGISAWMRVYRDGILLASLLLYDD
jgi:hypothetical protein